MNRCVCRRSLCAGADGDGTKPGGQEKKQERHVAKVQSYDVARARISSASRVLLCWVSQLCRARAHLLLSNRSDAEQ